MRRKFMIGFISGLILLLSGFLAAKGPAGSRTLHKSNNVAVQTLSNIGNVSYWLRADGFSAHNPFTSEAGAEYPRGTAGVIYQDGLIWGGLVNDTRNPALPRLRVGGQTYRIGTTGGWIVTPGSATAEPVAISPNDERVGTYRIRRDWRALKLGQATVINDAAELNEVPIGSVTDAMQQEVLDNYASDWENWPTDLGAPFYDVNDNGRYDPGTEIDLNGNGQIEIGEVEEPGLAGADQVVWMAFNDLDGGATSNLYGAPPIGLEVQSTVWAYNQPDATLGQLIFKRYRIINKSGFRIDSMFVAQWSDPDIGGYTDDLVGSDIERSLGYAYNGNQSDADFTDFSIPPGAIGYDFFQGPLVRGVAGQDRNGNGVDDAEDYAIYDLREVGPGWINLPLTSFGYFASGSAIDDPDLGEYDGTLQWYNLLNGYTTTADTANPTPFIQGFGENAGLATPFPVSGDPVRQSGDIDAFGTNLPPGDRRMALPSGPFTMLPGDTQEVVVAVVGGIVPQEGGNNRNAVAQLKLNDDFAQFVYNKLFQGIPRPPAAPEVNVTPLEERIVLEWGSNDAAIAETEKDDPALGFNFEAYNVYQLPGPNATKAQATLIATFDLNNSISTIIAAQFVPEFGDIVEVPIQKGTNSGIQRHFIVEKDYIKDRPLYAGNRYYFAVTAYNVKDEDGDGVVDSDVPEPALESALDVIEVIPQSPKPGTRYPNAVGESLAVEKTGFNDPTVQVTVVDPSAVSGHNYRVEFNQENQYALDPIVDDSTGQIVGYDTTGVWHTWNLIDETDGDKVLLADQTNLSGDNSYRIRDGLLVKVIGPKTGGISTWDFEGDRWVTGVDWGGAQFFGGLDLGSVFFGSTLGLSDLVPVQLVFQDQADVDANGYVSEGAVYRRDQAYAYAGTGKLPFAAYDVSDPDNPRQVNVTFVEDNSFAPANLIWDMGWDGSAYPDVPTGAREYIFIHKSDYNGGADYNAGNDGTVADVMFAIWPTQRGDRPYLLAPFTMDIFVNLPGTPADKFAFSTESVVVEDQNVARDDVEKIGAFPNPYYANNPEETSRFDRFLTITHLPRKASVRIFSLSGVQVRKIEKNDESQFLKWDLRNEANLPVASGIYFVHIEMPELGKEKNLKLFVIQGEEILDYF